MSDRTCFLLSSLGLIGATVLAGCNAPEKGFDETVLSGTVIIPPVSVDEKDSPAKPNDATPQALGDDGATALTYRSVILTGSTNSWVPALGDPGADDDEVYGDADLYAFTPVESGTFSVTVTFPTGPGEDTAAAADAVVYDIYIVDATSLDVLSGFGTASTDGSGGVVTVSADVVAGGDYVLVIGGVSNEGGDVEVPYTAVLSGSAPGEGTVLIGAYTEGDPAVASDPVGGTTATAWTYDDATYTWSATWELLYLRSVVMEGVTDSDPGEPVVDEALAGPIYLLAGTLTNLNGTPSAGSLYSTASVEADVTNQATTVDTALVMDGLFPKVIGIQSIETLPDTTFAALDANYAILEDTLIAQDLGMLSGLGYVDIVDGTAMLTGAAGWDGNDSDAYSFTVPEAMNVRMTASWANAADDIDFGIWGYYEGYGYIDWFSNFGDSYCLIGANPEACETVQQLQPDVTYYLLALGYAGDAEDEPYHIELEWAP